MGTNNLNKHLYDWTLKDEIRWRWKQITDTIRAPFIWIRNHHYPEYRQLLKDARRFEAWDWSYMMQLERSALCCMIAHHKKYQLVEGWENYVKWMTVCTKLIDIMNDGYSVHRVNTRNMDRFISEADRAWWHEGITLYPACQEELHRIKAEHLYHAIRAQYEREWWD